VAVVGHSNSSASLAASQIYNDAEVVQIAPTSTAPRYSEAGPFSFRLAPPDPEQGGLLSEAVDQLRPDGARVALLFVNDDYGRGLRDAVLTTFDQGRHRLVLDAPHNDFEVVGLSAEQGLRRDGDVASVIAQRPDIILWLGRSATFGHYLPELRRQLPDAQILGGDALSPGHALAAQAPEWVGVRYADFLDPESTPELRRFRDRFTTRFGTPARTAEVLSYDAMRLILAAVAGGARSGPEVRDWLLRLGRDLPPYLGLSGPIQFSADGDVERPFVLVTIPGQP
ncbi:MAG TPA: ABC transporter substrate-binding protein, partial [Gemmatimonadales bacterium]|nr:ABC transporter substrate-binding protein [Gemmatimonadales bacterium]